jgi:Oxidoreductase family, NAD-binding Rossmann fold
LKNIGLAIIKEHKVKSRLVLTPLLSFALVFGAFICSSLPGQEVKQMRLGMIGLDTSHVPAFAKLINDPEGKGKLAEMQVVAAFPGGSDDLPTSRDRVAGYTKELKDMGIEIVDSIETLLTKVDAVLLESVDGRKHLEQVLPVFRAGKPVFIDKPLAGNLADALAIDLLAKKYKAKWFSSSSLRFSAGTIRWREDPELKGQVKGAASWGPCSLEATHTDLYWYGVHGVETLYTAMGTGCKSVTRMHTEGTDFVAGQWADGRVGSFRGIRDGKADYGLVVFGSKSIDVGGKYDGYLPLVMRILDFFAGGDAPVTPDETIEMFTFMEAADVSRDHGGAPVTLESVKETALIEAKKIVAKLDPS